MSILKTKDQIQQAQAGIREGNWIFAMCRTSAQRREEIQRAVTRLPFYPEVRDSADVLFYIRAEAENGEVEVAMAADPDSESGRRFSRGFLKWTADNRLTLTETAGVEQCPELQTIVNDPGTPSEQTKAKDSGCLPIVLVVILLAGALVLTGLCFLSVL
ncbi:MAG: hypothetical protein K9N51_07335 [Candidatus Pacebacteria bacterium]|nr:hypothetical protein [Candidatus Paceibacterota bacterium]